MGAFEQPTGDRRTDTRRKRHRGDQQRHLCASPSELLNSAVGSHGSRAGRDWEPGLLDYFHIWGLAKEQDSRDCSARLRLAANAAQGDTTARRLCKRWMKLKTESVC